jgi:hypothetical protein
LGALCVVGAVAITLDAQALSGAGGLIIKGHLITITRRLGVSMGPISATAISNT